MALKKNPTESVINKIGIDIGKVPPQAIDIEEAVLGALMLEKDAVIAVIDILDPPACFYKESHRKIYSAIRDLSTNNKSIDILTVIEELKSRSELEEVGGQYYISQLTLRVASAAHIEYHARIIAQKYIQRELIRVSSEIQKKAFDESTDVLDLLNYSESELFKISEGNIRKETAKINIIIQTALKQIEEASKQEDGLSGVPSGFTNIDRITSGWQKSDLVIIAARPSMGKTAFVLTMARSITVDHKLPVAFFSLEMSSIQLANRLIVSETELPSRKIKNGQLEKYEWEQLEYKIKKLIDAPLYIDDTPALSIFELRAKCRRLKIQHDVQLIIVDYLQLMTAGGDSKSSREQEVSTISRSLKAIAKELDVPIIALSQLNRALESRKGDKRPQLSDLRESGALEQDADMVIFIHRPERYGVTEDGEGNSLIGLAEIIIAKHRNGPVGDVQLKFTDELAKFTEFDNNVTGIFSDENGENGSVTYRSKMNNEKINDFGLDDNKSDSSFNIDEEEPF
ncbi:MAG: replicative DNA helicase [Bacteroidales bacterium]|nr:replicative DNA helicase [Bacteroidales bacterium]